MEKTNDIDASGYWTIDNYTALTGPGHVRVAG